MNYLGLGKELADKVVVGGVYYTPSIVYLPVKVKVFEIKNKKARIEQGWINLDRLYKTEEDCPQR